MCILLLLINSIYGISNGCYLKLAPRFKPTGDVSIYSITFTLFIWYYSKDPHSGDNNLAHAGIMSTNRTTAHAPGDHNADCTKEYYTGFMVGSNSDDLYDDDMYYLHPIDQWDEGEYIEVYMSAQVHCDNNREAQIEYVETRRCFGERVDYGSSGSVPLMNGGEEEIEYNIDVSLLSTISINSDLAKHPNSAIFIKKGCKYIGVVKSGSMYTAKMFRVKDITSLFCPPSDPREKIVHNVRSSLATLPDGLDSFVLIPNAGSIGITLIADFVDMHDSSSVQVEVSSSSLSHKTSDGGSYSKTTTHHTSAIPFYNSHLSSDGNVIMYGTSENYYSDSGSLIESKYSEAFISSTIEPNGMEMKASHDNKYMIYEAAVYEFEVPEGSDEFFVATISNVDDFVYDGEAKELDFDYGPTSDRDVKYVVMMINADRINPRCSAGKYTLIDTFGDTHLLGIGDTTLQKNSDGLYITPYSSSLPLIFSKSDSARIKIQLKCTDAFDILTNNTSGNDNLSKPQDVNDSQYVKIKKNIIYIMVGCVCLVLIVGMVISGLWCKRCYHNQLVRQQANMMEATNPENL